MIDEKVIGIVGGVGPYAGLDLTKKIFDLTEASTDQEHLNVALISMSSNIADRTAFLVGASDVNPALGIVEVVKKLEQVGARVAGIPCNSAHAPPIFDVVLEKLEADNCSVKLLNMIQETFDLIRETHSDLPSVGVLSTSGSRKAGIFTQASRRCSFEIVLPDAETQKLVHQAIYDRDFGVKAHSNPVTAQAREQFLKAIESLARAGVQGIILGCTEIPLAIPEKKIGDIDLFDPALALARALIKEIHPERLKPLN